MKNLLNKKILFIICGGISAYKSLETIRLFKKNGAEIKTILTTSAKEFVTPLSITSLSQGKVYSDLFSLENNKKLILLLIATLQMQLIYWHPLLILLLTILLFPKPVKVQLGGQ